MMHVTNLRYSYDGSRFITFPDLHIACGSHWLLLGESGSGKTTLLHLLGGLLRGGQGSIVVEGTDITSFSESELDQFRGRILVLYFSVAI